MYAVEQGDGHVLQHVYQCASEVAVIRWSTAVLPLTPAGDRRDSGDMNAITDTLVVLGILLILALPALVGYAHELRVDRQLRAAGHRSGQASAGRSRRGLTTHDVVRAA